MPRVGQAQLEPLLIPRRRFVFFVFCFCFDLFVFGVQWLFKSNRWSAVKNDEQKLEPNQQTQMQNQLVAQAQQHIQTEAMTVDMFEKLQLCLNSQLLGCDCIGCGCVVH